MKTQSDRTLFFDLLPLDLGEIMGFKTRFLLYTVPGQVFYNATRKLVLKGADAIVFVADSEVGKMEENKESLENLRANLAEYRLSLDDIPWVIQYNKRDLPNLYTCDELNAELNQGGKVPYFEAVATQGKGVFETFRGISHLLMEKVTKDLRRSSPSTAAPRQASLIEDPAPVAATPTAPPSAPAHVISREAHETRVAEAAAIGSDAIDYGRQIELPSEIPPPAAAPVAHAPVATAPASPATRSPRVMSFDDTNGEAGQVPAGAFAPATTGREPERPAAEAPRREPSPVRGATSAAPASEAATTPEMIVVPVTLPADGRPRELVIKLIIQPPPARAA
jgi:signal recognition particle receptor subunit beta